MAESPGPMTPTVVRAASILSVFSVLALSACSQAAPEPSDPPVAIAPSPSPTETEAPEVDDVLFVVAARVRAIDGTSIDISMTAHTPLKSTDEKASELAKRFVDECADQGGTNVSDVSSKVSIRSLAELGSSLMKLDIESSPTGKIFYAPVDLMLGSVYFPEVVVGDEVESVDANETCTGSYQLTGSGKATAIANYESGSSVPDLGQWRYGHYGFSVPFESKSTIEACKVDVTPLALETLEGVPGWGEGEDSTGISCGIGYRGE